MSVELRQIDYGSHKIVFAVDRRDRRTLEIAVEPDLSVYIAAPACAAPEDIDAKVRNRAAWILKQQAFFRQFLPRTPERQFIAGETHLYLGRQYRLKVRPGLIDRVRFYRGYIDIETIRPRTNNHIRDMVQAWYRDRAKMKFAERLQLCRQRFASPETVKPKALIVRKLSQRWGSMSPAGRLVLNTRLIEAPVDAIDYVITHELCHIFHPHHGPAFFDLLVKVLPDWERRKAKLEKLMA
jgi:predicted metal-dependent hydrolase